MENLNVNVPNKKPSHNKAMLGHVAANLNLSGLSLSSANPFITVVLQPGPSSAAPKISETQKSVPQSSEKSAVRSATVGDCTG